MTPEIPALLAEAIRADLKPVRPLLPPALRTALLMILAVTTAAAFMALRNLRPDLAAMVSWMFAAGMALRIAAGMLLLLIATREAVPSQGVARSISLATIVSVIALIVTLPFAVAEVVGPVEANDASGTMICYLIGLAIATPAFIMTAILLARGYPVRPFRAAIAAGLGCGLIADAAVFAHCAVDSPLHVLAAHEGAVVTLAVIGALVAVSLLRRPLTASPA